jgi:hypothetical protein
MTTLYELGPGANAVVGLLAFGAFIALTLAFQAKESGGTISYRGLDIAPVTPPKKVSQTVPSGRDFDFVVRTLLRLAAESGMMREEGHLWINSAIRLTPDEHKW